ncbi:MAG: sulfurtransferase [Thermoplasmata archaeon]|nr:sulfurtransferase [Thermoplasmata archaeon]
MSASPVISVETLAANRDDPNLLLVDARWYLGRPGAGHDAYLAGHIPGAMHLDLDTDLADPGNPAAFGAPGRHPLPDPVAWARSIGARGIGNESRVVGYDDVGGWVAARLWWMLDDLGFSGASVLDGGIGAWTAAGLSLSTGVEPPRAPRALHLRDRWTRVIERDVLRERLGSVVLLDARGAARYRGEVEPIDPVAGHIPTAISAPVDGDLGPDGRLLDPRALRRRFEALGAAGDQEVVTSCGSGTSACLHALAMRLVGLPDPILYVGSYSDWSRSGLPVAVGPEPGEPPR